MFKVRTSAVLATACHQGSTPRLDPRPHALSIYINNIAQAVGGSLIYLYADDSLILSWPLPDVVLNALQQSFLSVQQAFSTLNLVLNTSKTQVMWIGKKNAPLPTGVITTSEGLELEVVTSYKYLGVWLDGALSFSQHISKLQAKDKSRLGFLYRNRSSFTHSFCQTNPDLDDHPTHARLRKHNL